jgi:hypothetical protein
MNELQPRTPAEALAGLPASERRELLELAIASRRITTIEHRLEAIERHLAGNCLQNCPCQPGQHRDSSDGGHA